MKRTIDSVKKDIVIMNDELVRLQIKRDNIDNAIDAIDLDIQIERAEFAIKKANEILNDLENQHLMNYKKKVDKINKDHRDGEINVLTYSEKMRNLLKYFSEKSIYEAANYLINHWYKYN